VSTSTAGRVSEMAQTKHWTLVTPPPPGQVASPPPS
jgi:hypothetical protein